jgi:hypothetical protein
VLRRRLRVGPRPDEDLPSVNDDPDRGRKVIFALFDNELQKAIGQRPSPTSDAVQAEAVAGRSDRVSEREELDLDCAECGTQAAEFSRPQILGKGYFVSTVGRDEEMIRAYISFASTWGSAIFHYCGYLDDHRLQVEEALAVSKQIGFPFFVTQAEIWGAWNRLMIGDLSDANFALFESALSHSADMGNGSALPYLRALLAGFLADRGKIAQALALLQGAIERVDAV